MEAINMDNIIDLVFIAANIVSCARLLTYERGDSNFKPHMSWIAYILVVCSGGQAIDAALEPVPVTIWASIISIVLCVLILRAKGNVAAIVRIT